MSVYAYISFSITHPTLTGHLNYGVFWFIGSVLDLGFRLNQVFTDGTKEGLGFLKEPKSWNLEKKYDHLVSNQNPFTKWSIFRIFDKLPVAATWRSRVIVKVPCLEHHVRLFEKSIRNRCGYKGLS